jgi:hypothetical protein
VRYFYSSTVDRPPPPPPYRPHNVGCGQIIRAYRVPVKLLNLTCGDIARRAECRDEEVRLVHLARHRIDDRHHVTIPFDKLFVDWDVGASFSSLPYISGSDESKTTSFLIKLLFGENDVSRASDPRSIPSCSVQRPAL